MEKKTKPINDSIHHYYYEDINICPICEHKISPNYLNSYLHHDKTKLSLYCECTSCNKPFIVLFSKIEKNNDNKKLCSEIEYCAPSFSKKVEFDDQISNLSNSFVEIFNEAHQAENHKLNHICGMAYKKALEFLIKDYCIFKNPEDEDKIKSSLLGQVINKYIDSEKIKNLAKASVFIGNDESHYIRKFENKDINDLKRFISATVAFITYELISESADKFVESK